MKLTQTSTTKKVGKSKLVLGLAALGITTLIGSAGAVGAHAAQTPQTGNGYGNGSGNTVNNNLNLSVNGNNNVISVVINYIFGSK